MESFNATSTPNREQDFQKLCNTIGTSIQKINQNVSSMQRMVKQFGTHQNSPDLRQQFNSLQQYTHKLVVDTNTCIKELSAFPASPSQSEQRQRKMQKSRLQDEFTMSLSAFQGAQRSAAQKEKELVKEARSQAYVDPFAGHKKEQQLIELQDNSVAKQQQQMQEEADMRSLLEQEEAIQSLEKDILDVNQIFKDLGSLVHDQGETIDSIEASVERTENYVSQGTQQLREAATYKNKIVRKKVYIALIAAVILAIIIIIIVTSVK